MLAKTEYFTPRHTVAMPHRMLITAVRPTYKKVPEKVSAVQLARCLTLPFRPKLTKSLMHLEQFQDLPIDEVKMLVRALIIDLDGTLIKPGMDHIPHDVMEKIMAIREKMPVCIFSDDQEYPVEFEQNGIPVVRNVPSKTDPRSFDVAIQICLQNRHGSTRMLYPNQCAVVADNFLTDGTCREIGMGFIHVESQTGRNESTTRTVTRDFADWVARFHDRFRKNKKRMPKLPEHSSLPHGK